jgi:cobalt/nickel transport system permease protein
MPLVEYHAKDHLLTRIDARIKIIAALASLAMVLSYKGFALPIVVIFTCLATCVRIKVPIRLFALRFSEPLFIAAVLVVIKLFFTGKSPLFSFNLAGLTITGYMDGLVDGLMIAVRIIAAVSIITTISFATPFTEFMAGLSWLRIPKTFIEVLLFTYRYIFVLFEDAMVIYNAQKNRLGYSNIRRGLGSFGTLAGSLILKAFEHSHNITVSMIQRGYDGNMPMLKHKPFKLSEIVVSVLFITAMGVIWKI